MEVQGLQAGLIWGYPANAAYAAVAIRAASTVLTITNHGELRRQNADGSSSAPLSFASHQLGDLTATYEQSGSTHLSTGSGHSWRIHFPGGGSLLAGSWPAARAMPAGFIYGLWLSVPPAAVASATGLCAGSCRGLPYLPFRQCSGLAQLDRCYPVFEDESLFPPYGPPGPRASHRIKRVV